MNRKSAFKDNEELKEFFEKFSAMYKLLGNSFLTELKRLPSLPDMIVDRWERAKMLGFDKYFLMVGRKEEGSDKEIKLHSPPNSS